MLRWLRKLGHIGNDALLHASARFYAKPNDEDILWTHLTDNRTDFGRAYVNANNQFIHDNQFTTRQQ